jgi:hypothetical protein
MVAVIAPSSLTVSACCSRSVAVSRFIYSSPAQPVSPVVVPGWRIPPPGQFFVGRQFCRKMRQNLERGDVVGPSLLNDLVHIPQALGRVVEFLQQRDVVVPEYLCKRLLHK